MENKLKILIADDEIDITELLKSFLSSHGYECDTVTNGKDTLNRVREKKYDIILLDIMMPYIDGYHVAYEITNEIENPPHIIMMTSRDIQFEKNIAKMSGAFEIIQKPFILASILQLISKAIEQRKQKMEGI